MAVRVLEVEAALAPAGVDFPVGVVVWPATVGDLLRLHPAEDPVELRVADVEGEVMTVASPGVEARPAPRFWLVREVEGQALVDLHLREVAIPRLDCQAEDLGEELGRGSLVLCRHDGVIEPNRHDAAP